MKEETTVHYDSPEAASVQTVTGWVSRGGRFWGDNEHMARWDGCTHVVCEGCSSPSKKPYTHCEACRRKKEAERFAAFPHKPWDGSTPVSTQFGDDIFWDMGDLMDYCDDNGIRSEEDLKSLRLVHCSPETLRPVDESYWTDELPEDINDLPDEVYEALDALNEACKNAGTVMWFPMDEAVALTPEQCEEILREEDE